MSIDAMKLALEALEFDGFTPEDATHRYYTTKAITALRAAIEQPRQWQGLTDEEIDYLCGLAYTGDEELILTIQSKLKEKNT